MSGQPRSDPRARDAWDNARACPCARLRKTSSRTPEYPWWFARAAPPETARSPARAARPQRGGAWCRTSLAGAIRSRGRPRRSQSGSCGPRGSRNGPEPRGSTSCCLRPVQHRLQRGQNVEGFPVRGRPDTAEMRQKPIIQGSLRRTILRSYPAGRGPRLAPAPPAPGTARHPAKGIKPSWRTPSSMALATASSGASFQRRDDRAIAPSRSSSRASTRP